jgi:tRNA A37 threonylcarbamoyladenosine synthetase subunit TsaC/SUA5/YrdC
VAPQRVTNIFDVIPTTIKRYYVTSQFISQDAQRAFDVLRDGGIAIIPMDVGYTAAGGSGAALQKIFDAKQRGPTKLNAMCADNEIAFDVYQLSERAKTIIKVITEDYDLPLGAIAPCQMDHPLLQVLDERAVSASTKNATLVMLLNAGPFHREICRLSREHGHPIFGSSANISMSGTKFRVEDIEPEITNIADLIIDHGLRKFHHYRESSTLLNIETLEVVRHGSCFELIADIMNRRFNIELPARIRHE